MTQRQTISIAIVENEEKKYLISRRQEGQHLAGKWEFPGGKVEEGEMLEEAMQRELKEEVGLNAVQYCLFNSLTFHYDSLELDIKFYLVTQFEGNAIGLEGQQVKWVLAEELSGYDFPKANREIIKRLLSRA